MGGSVLPVDLYEDDDSIHVHLEIPGISPRDLSLHVDDSQLIIEGYKNIRREEKMINFTK